MEIIITKDSSFFCLARACSNALPTSFNLYKRKVISLSNCKVCGAREESILHTLIQCPLAKAVWKNANLPFSFNDLQCFSFLDLIKQVAAKHDNDLLEWILIIAWSILYEKNRVVHGQQLRGAIHIV